MNSAKRSKNLNKTTKNTQKTGERRGGKRSTSWKKGQSGNPNGAPRKGMSWKELINSIGDDALSSGVYAGLSRKEAMIYAAFEHAIKGNAAMLKELMQRSDMLPQELNVTVRDVEQIRAERWKQFAPALAAALQEDEPSASAEGAGDE